MPRPQRLNLPGVPQHVIQRGNNRQACFFADCDYRLYLDLLGEACHTHRCEFHAYVLMTNHVHLLMTPHTPEGVSLVMRDLGRDYVRTVNKRCGRTGTMWEGRFKSSLVDNEAYCLCCYRYIELNPVRARMVASPGDYRWSSFRSNALGKPDPILSPHEVWMALGDNAVSRRRSYRNLFEQPLNSARIEEIRYAIRKGLPAGSSQFKEQIESLLSVELGDGKRGRPKKHP